MNIYNQIHSNMPKEELTSSFIAACHVGDINALISLLTNPEFEKHIDVHFNKDAAFKWILFNNRMEAMHYLIMEYKIEKTDAISEVLNSSIKEGIIESAIRLFNTREINDILEKELNHNKDKYKKPKL